MRRLLRRWCPHWFGWRYERAPVWGELRTCRLCQQQQEEWINHCTCFHDVEEPP